MVPIASRLVEIVPRLPVPIRSYLDWKPLIDRRPPAEAIESRLVEAYLHDPDFDRWYPLAAVMSLMTTPPPGPIQGLVAPTMFMIARSGPTPAYLAELFDRLTVRKERIELDGGVYWMLSHPADAAATIDRWFSETLRPHRPRALSKANLCA